MASLNPLSTAQTQKDEHEKEAVAKKVVMFGWNSETLAWERINVSDGSLVIEGLRIPTHDACSVTFPNSTTTVYTYKDGGLSGTTVGTLTVIYTDSTKEVLLSYELT